MNFHPGLDAELDQTQLLDGLRAGDKSAYETLVNHYSGRMLMVTRRLLPREEDARDALQEAFISAFRGLSSFDGRAQLGTWLHRIAVNAALMKLRSQKRRPELAIDDLLPSYLEDGHRRDAGPAWNETAEQTAEQAETRRLVRQCIEQLPENYRVVLILRDIEEMDTATVAEYLGIEEGAVKTRLHRARQALRTLLDPYFRGEPL